MRKPYKCPECGKQTDMLGMCPSCFRTWLEKQVQRGYEKQKEKERKEANHD